MRYHEEKIINLAKRLFNEDCDRENLLYKLQTTEERIATVENQIMQAAAYPNEVVTYEFENYTLRITPRGVQVFTKDQYEKTEYFRPDEEF